MLHFSVSDKRVKINGRSPLSLHLPNYLIFICTLLQHINLLPRTGCKNLSIVLHVLQSYYKYFSPTCSLPNVSSSCVNKAESCFSTFPWGSIWCSVSQHNDVCHAKTYIQIKLSINNTTTTNYKAQNCVQVKFEQSRTLS